MLFIKEYRDFDFDRGEGEVIISDGRFELSCYADLFYPKTSNLESNYQLIPLSVDELKTDVEGKYYIQKLDSPYFSYKLFGKLYFEDKIRIQIGDIKIVLSSYDVPGDIRSGCFVSVVVSRIDITRNNTNVEKKKKINH